MRTDTMRMSSEVPPADRRARRSSGRQSRSASAPRVGRCQPPNLVGHAHHLHHLAARRARARCARRPGRPRSPPRPSPSRARPAGASPSAARRNDLRDGPTRSGPTEPPRKLGQAAPAPHSCAPGVWRTRSPDRATIRSRWTPAAARDAMLRRAAPSPTSSHDVGVVRLGVHVARPSARVHQDERRRRVSATTPPSAGSYRRPLMSLTMRGARRRPPLGDRGLVGVDRDRESRTRAASRLEHRQHARAVPRRADTAAAPGRVDSPPTSMRSAPAASIAQRRRRRRGAGVETRPPSANESGVTLRMPMTSVRSPSDNAPSGSGTVKRTRRIETETGQAGREPADRTGRDAAAIPAAPAC